jgi:hypothetical protein
MPKYVSGEWVTHNSYTNSDRYNRIQERVQARLDRMKLKTKYGQYDFDKQFGDMFKELEAEFGGIETEFKETFETMEEDFNKKFDKSIWDLMQQKKKPKNKVESISDSNKDKRQQEIRKVKPVNQFLTLDIGSNKATVDLSKVRKQGLLFEKSMFGKKPKIVIYYLDRPETPEVNFELNSEDEARKVYDKINKRLEEWAEASNSAKIAILERELEVMREQKEAMLEEKEVLMDVFNSFKEMMQIMEDDNKTSSLVETIKDM